MKELKGIGPEIPEKWCVRRTPDNAEMLNAWGKSKSVDWEIYTNEFIESTAGYITSEGYGFIFLASNQYPEITFDEWQAIPGVAEWLKEYAKSLGFKLTEKVEEREIIGYEAPRDLFGKRIKAGTVFTKCAITTVSFEYIHGQTILPAEIVETWKPVYAEKPVFKVGDWIRDSSSGFVAQVTGVNISLKRYDSGPKAIYFDRAIAATAEDIEEARPKRKYMKQVWYVMVADSELNIVHVSKQHDSEEEAHKWELENSKEGRVYSVKPFEVVAYE